jgi:hypothetical protein
VPAVERLVQRAQFVAQLQRLRPAWGELRAVLHELNRALGESCG